MANVATKGILGLTGLLANVKSTNLGQRQLEIIFTLFIIEALTVAPASQPARQLVNRTLQLKTQIYSFAVG